MFYGSSRGSKDDRVPPNQKVTTGFPVLHYGNVPEYKDLSQWDFRIFGAVEEEKTLSFSEFKGLPVGEVHNDIHCVTGWSKLDNVWEGVRVEEVVKLVTIKPEAKYVMLHAEEGWTTNMPLEDFMAKGNLFGFKHNGEDLTPDHGYPLRFVIPHLYFWKSAKWVRGIEFLEKDKPGFWEKNGYHMYGDPFREQRYAWD
ncbi:sulfite oxidase-like oxidoreductase [Brevibacillus laterosporus]|uniref:sulfite oxidase-like oxidoreductase n=1 Tax=Brevibacillus laterosporus TaxID=1465 RepID=UPI00265088B1|nr:sulfite oxidase-like oxidoreductase [Brevibacillus laterosporus]MDN9011760.1 sulfite oxidase-like oxidoreductase [Brevibacillus laterosporus]MDO0942760.1 sulfite oxidase-like oxidoreductase [Brevibacillus laterosporus]